MMAELPKLMLVDDKRENLLALEGMLREHAVQLLRATSGRSALEVLLEHEVALAIIDVQMPELDGFELAELMRGLARTRDVPIIFVTAGLHEQSRIFKGYESGAVDFLVKPLDPHVLASKVRVFLQLYLQKRQLADRVLDLEAALRAAKEASSALECERDRSAWLARLPEENPDPVVRARADGRVLYTNPGARALPAISAAAFEGTLPPELCASVAEALAQACPVNTEVCWDERSYSVTLSPAGSEVNLYFHDITARKQTETCSRTLNSINQLIHSTRNLSEIFNGAIREAASALGAESAAVSLRDSRCWTLSFAFGLPEEVIGTKMDDEEERHGIIACTQGQPVAIEDTSTDPRVDCAHMKKWGIRAVLVVPLLLRGNPLGVAFFNFHTRPKKFTPAHIDFGAKLASAMSLAIENARLIANLEASERGLREADRRKDEFLAVLSHELRNPLAPIINGLSILERVPSESEQGQRARQVVNRQVNQLASLINDLLDVTRVTTNKINLQRTVIELNELVRKAVEDNRSLFEKNGIELEVKLDSHPIRVDADATRLAQVVGNLLQNAAKFTGRGGRTSIEVSADESSAIIRVNDTGVGMKSETLERLFQPFMQAEQSLDRSKGGLGLGLALVKGLVELHGGAIAARSAGLGQGSEFTVQLPLLQSQSDDLAPVPTPLTPAVQHRILLIEDNVDAADILRDLLELSNHTVEIAHNGSDGIRKARTFKPDVVFCDIGLPGMDGYEVARTFRRDESLKRVFLVALSGYALPEDQRTASEAGFQCHLAKPPKLSALQALLNRL